MKRLTDAEVKLRQAVDNIYRAIIQINQLQDGKALQVHAERANS